MVLEFDGTGGEKLTSSGFGRLFRRKDGKYLIYLPLRMATDSQFPFPTESSMKVKVSFKIGEKQLLIEPLSTE